MSTAAAPRRYAHIDALRALAVLLVVVSHNGMSWVPGGAGVTIFFGISGFVIANRTLSEERRTGRFDVAGFYIRRLVKLGPAFVVVVLLPSLVYACFRRLDWGAFLTQVFFSFNWTEIVDPDVIRRIVPGTHIVWSLAIEEQFYIFFALLWLFLVRRAGNRRRLAWFAVAGVVIATALRCWLALQPMNSQRIYLGTDTRMDGLALGILLALWVNDDRVWPRLRAFLRRDWVLLFAVVIFLASLVLRTAYFRDTFRYTIQVLACLLVVNYGLEPGTSTVRRMFDAVAGWRPVQAVGLASYAIYLVHNPLGLLVFKRFHGPALPLSLASILAGVLLGWLIYRFVEIPVGERYRRHRTSAQPRSTR